jgi:mRNA interferase MazF
LASPESPRRGQVWLIDLGDYVGRQAGMTRPSLVISDDRFNTHDLVVICPLTRTSLGYETPVEIEAKSAGIRKTSYVQVEQIRTISRARLVRHLGQIDILATMKIGRILRYLLVL